MIGTGIVIIFLTMAAIYDMKKKEIPTKCLLVWGAIQIVYVICFAIWGKDVFILVRSLIGLIPGVVCLFISYVSREQMGYGDGCVVMLIGFLGGFKNAVISFVIALFLLSLVAAVLLAIKKATRKSRLPFVPFLLFGYLGAILCFG